MAKAKKQENADVTESAEKAAKKPTKAKAAKVVEETPTAAAADAPAPKAKKPAAKAFKAETPAPAAEVKPAAKAAKPAEKEAVAKSAEKAPAAKPAEKAAKPAAATKADSKPAQAKPSASNPYFSGIDTSQAARAAASVVANRDLLGGLGSTKPEATAKPEQKIESSSFKNLKQSLNQPAGLNKLFGGSDGKKGGLPFGSAGGGSLRNQTGSANKLGVPRRTNG